MVEKAEKPPVVAIPNVVGVTHDSMRAVWHVEFDDKSTMDLNDMEVVASGRKSVVDAARDKVIHQRISGVK